MRKPGQETIPMNISEALWRGYEFHLTEGRLAFRTPYGQPDSFSAQVTVKIKPINLNATKCMVFVLKCQQVNGIPVEVVHPILFLRQGWAITKVDLMASCSMRKYQSGKINVQSTLESII